VNSYNIVNGLPYSSLLTLLKGAVESSSAYLKSPALAEVAFEKFVEDIIDIYSNWLRVDNQLF
jgi:hypothetical protein